MHGMPLKVIAGSTLSAGLALTAALAAAGLVVRGSDGRPATAATGPVGVASTVPAPVATRAPSPPPVRARSQTPPAPQRPQEPVRRPVVVLYGDSLSFESAAHFVGAFAGQPEIRVRTRTFGGTATCDWLDRMREDAEDLVPDYVVIEFAGNAFTPCMRDASGSPVRGDAFIERYRTTTEEALAVFAPVRSRVFLVSPPPVRPDIQNEDFAGPKLRELYRDLAGRAPDVTYLDAAAAVLDGGAWTAVLPCLVAEPCPAEGGQAVNPVRSPDGVHFCPAALDPGRPGTVDPCPVWSSGAHRFGTAMAAAVLEQMERSDRNPSRLTAR